MTSSSTIALLSPPSQIQEALVFGIDSDVQDPLPCRDITDDIVHNMRLVEASRKLEKDYMERTHVVDSGKRARCVEWLTDTAGEICESPNTLYLAINYLNRYLLANNENENLDFVGMTCLLIALKYEEVEGYFSFDRYTYIGYSVEDFVRMENSIICCLKYDLAGPTVHTFLGRYVRAAYLGRKNNNNNEEEEEEGYDLRYDLELMASYLARISLVSYRMIGYSSSLVAASSVFLAQYIMDPSERPWSNALQRYTGYEASDLRECVLELEAARDMYGWITWISPTQSIPPQFFSNIS